MYFSVVFFFQAEDGIRDLVRSRGLGDVYKRQEVVHALHRDAPLGVVLDRDEDERAVVPPAKDRRLSLIHI